MAPYLGLLQPGVTNYKYFFETAKRNLYGAIVIPLHHNGLPHEFEQQPLADKEYNHSYPDLLLPGSDWTASVIGMVSDDIDCDSENEDIRKHSEKVLLHDFGMAEYLLSGGFVMLRLKSGKVTNLARIVAEKCKSATVLIRVPAFAPKLNQAAWRKDVKVDSEESVQEEDGWSWWNNFRWICDFNHKLKVCLELNSDDVIPEPHLRRWLGEPIDSVILPATIFKRNSTNTPILAQEWTFTIGMLIRAGVSLILSASAHDNNLKQYAEYINRMKSECGSQVAPGYEDVLEIPLQPLHDNLNSYTYEVFEQDPTKYVMYQKAIMAALIDRVSENAIRNTLTVIMILGAGRGPLVRSALNAAKKTKRRIRIYVIEKNPNAIRTLRNLKDKLWKNEDVHIFSKDMREFSPPEKADILVSELLGSFGDNELSPECLDCAVKLLKPDGISIPSKSTSFINPVMSSKLYTAVRTISRAGSLGDDKYSVNHISPESGFVVLLKNVFNIDLPKPLFEFTHPNLNALHPIDNTRYGKLKFTASLDTVLHGVAGYFQAELYKDIILSTNPLTHTPNMQSWFPMYFPFTQPVPIKQGETIEIHFWRCVSSYKVWYEWCLVQPVQTHIHNLNGRCCPIYLS